MKSLLALILMLAAPPCHAAEIVRHGDVIEISGQLLDGDIAEFQSAITAGHALVILTGPGGSLRDGVMIGVMLHASGYDTAASGMCYSACALAWLGGKHRVMPVGARIGFHAAWMSGPAGGHLACPKCAEYSRDYERGLGLSEAAIDWTLSTDGIRVLTKADADRLGIAVTVP